MLLVVFWSVVLVLEGRNAAIFSGDLTEEEARPIFGADWVRSVCLVPARMRGGARIVLSGSAGASSTTIPPACPPPVLAPAPVGCGAPWGGQQHGVSGGDREMVLLSEIWVTGLIAVMPARPKQGPPRLGPPSQLMGGMKVPVVQQQFARKVQPKMRELVSRHVKLIAKWLHNQFSWKQFLMGWMVVLIASKMVLLALTFPFFTLTSLVSLQVSTFLSAGQKVKS